MGAGLRLFKLGSNPPGLTWDEAALGYNAYSLWQTGKDEYGFQNRLTLQSIGDFKPSMYTYFTIPSVAVFGLTEFAVRLPGALFGILAIPLVFLITRKLFASNGIGLLTALVLALSPWHIHFSRGAWEANTAFTITLIGLYFFLKSLKKSWWLLGSAIAFPLALYTYQSSRLFVPILGVSLLIIYRKHLYPLKLGYMVASIIGLILLIPLIVTMIQSENRSSLTVQSMFSYTRPSEEIQKTTEELRQSSNSATMRVFHSQQGLWARVIIERTLQYMSPSYLFVTGDPVPRYRAPGVAQGYFVDIIFYLLGIFALVVIPFDKRAKSLLAVWMVLAPLPAVLSQDPTQALQSLQMVFAVNIIIAIGIWYFIRSIRGSLRIKACCYTLILSAYVFNIAYYLDAYHVHMPERTGRYFLTGYKPAIEAIAPIYKEYDKVLMTTDYNAPYIYALFYLGIKPEEFQKQAQLTRTRGVDVGAVQSFNNFEFRHIYYPSDRALKNVLFIGTEEELPDQDIATTEGAELLKTIKFADGTTAFKIVRIKN